MNCKSVFIRTLITAVLMFGLASTASAYYASVQGRFISRDPINSADQSNAIIAVYPRTEQIPPVVGSIAMRVGTGVGNLQSQGRTVKQDPIKETPYVDGMNLYQYVHSNPIIYVDPSGLIGWPWPLNSRVCNKSSDMCLITWSDSTGYSLLKPGQCTSYWRDHGDFAYWNGYWYKCRGGYTCSIDDREISEYPDDPNYLPPIDRDSVKDNWHPKPPSEGLCKQYCDCNEKSSKHGSMNDKCECIQKCSRQR